MNYTYGGNTDYAGGMSPAANIGSMNSVEEYKPEEISIAEKIVDQLIAVIGKGYKAKLNTTALKITANALIDIFNNIKQDFYKYVQQYIDINDAYITFMLKYIVKEDKTPEEYNNLITAVANNLHVLYLSTYIHNITNYIEDDYITSLLNHDPDTGILIYYYIHSNPLLFYVCIEYIILNGGEIKFKESMMPTQPLIDYILVNNIVQTIMKSKHSINTNLQLADSSINLNAIKRTHFDYHGVLTSSIHMVPANKILVIMTPFNRIALTTYTEMEQYVISEIFNNAHILNFINNYTCYIDSIRNAVNTPDCLMYGMQVYYPYQYYYDMNLSLSLYDTKNKSFNAMGTYKYTYGTGANSGKMIKTHNRTLINSSISKILAGNIPDIYTPDDEVELIFVTSCRSFRQGKIDNHIIEMMYRFNKMHNIITDTISECKTAIEPIKVPININTCAYDMYSLYYKHNNSIPESSNKNTLLFNSRLTLVRNKQKITKKNRDNTRNDDDRHYDRVFLALLTESNPMALHELNGYMVYVLQKHPTYISDISKKSSMYFNTYGLNYKRVLDVINYMIINDTYEIQSKIIDNKILYTVLQLYISYLKQLYELLKTNVINKDKYKTIILQIVDIVNYISNLYSVFDYFKNKHEELINDLSSTTIILSSINNVNIKNIYDIVIAIYNRIYDVIKNILSCILVYEQKGLLVIETLNKAHILYLSLFDYITTINTYMSPIYIIFVFYELNREFSSLLSYPIFNDILSFKFYNIKDSIDANNTEEDEAKYNLAMENIVTILFKKIKQSPGAAVASSGNITQKAQKATKRKHANIFGLSLPSKKTKVNNSAQNTSNKSKLDSFIMFVNEHFINAKQYMATLIKNKYLELAGPSASEVNSELDAMIVSESSNEPIREDLMSWPYTVRNIQVTLPKF